MIIVSPPNLNFLFNTNFSKLNLDGKLFLKTFCSTYLIGSLLLTNFYSGYETFQRIKEKKGLERKTAVKLKEDFKKESIFFKPFLFGEYIVANQYIKNN